MPITLSESFQDILDLRTKVEAALLSYLGTYDYTDDIDGAVTLPAIYVVRNHQSDPPRHWKTSGLECLIYPPKSVGTPFFGGTAKVLNTYDIRLIQHDRSLDTNRAFRALLMVFPDCQFKSLLTQTDEQDEMLNVFLFDSDLLF